MHLTDASGNIAGLFTDGDPLTGVQSTILGAKWCNAVQGELANVVLGSGIALSDAADDQVLAALKRLFGVRGIAAFSTPGAGTWTVPANVTHVFLQMVGGGGGGGAGAAPGCGGGGGAGEGLFATLTVTPGATINYVIGAGGAGGVAGTAGGQAGNGVASSFGALVAAFGNGGAGPGTPAGGQGGLTVSALDGIRISGGDGFDGSVAANVPTGNGGASIFGGGGRAGDGAGFGAKAFGSGGGACYGSAGNGGAGRGGLILLRF